MKNENSLPVKIIEILLTIIMIIWKMIEILAVPVLFAVIGLLNDYGYIYYICTMGGYILLLGIVELAAFALDKLFSRKFETVFEKLLNRICNIFSKK